MLYYGTFDISIRNTREEWQKLQLKNKDFFWICHRGSQYIFWNFISPQSLHFPILSLFPIYLNFFSSECFCDVCYCFKCSFPFSLPSLAKLGFNIPMSFVIGDCFVKHQASEHKKIYTAVCHNENWFALHAHLHWIFHSMYCYLWLLWGWMINKFEAMFDPTLFHKLFIMTVNR